jgi:transposase-like protein
MKLVIEEKLSWAKAACQLSWPTSSVGNWVKAYQEGKLGDIGKTYRPLTEIEMELARNDILLVASVEVSQES